MKCSIIDTLSEYSPAEYSPLVPSGSYTLPHHIIGKVNLMEFASNFMEHALASGMSVILYYQKTVVLTYLFVVNVVHILRSDEALSPSPSIGTNASSHVPEIEHH
mgnify:CR=1 FL=1